jgi:branched-chain amino acid transport system ATP-binding protein
MALLEVRKLTARYGPVQAVRDASLEVHAGEAVALLGANGAGKSTTLAAIAGVLRARTGQISFGGVDMTSLAPEHVVRAGISLCPEGRRLFRKLTVADNLRLGGATRRRDKRGLAETQSHLMGLFPVLKTRFKSAAGELSGGEQQQVAIARALMAQPRLLLLDEPSLGLAPILITRLFALIDRIRVDDGVAVLLVEQNVRQALRVCDRAYVMRGGVIEREGNADELQRSHDLEQSYLGLNRQQEAPR